MRSGMIEPHVLRSVDGPLGAYCTVLGAEPERGEGIEGGRGDDVIVMLTRFR
jgi:hypothetical protein